jgi:hypothetical protein
MGKARELLERVLILDPQGQNGAFRPDWINGNVRFSEYAEYALGFMAAMKPTQDPKPLVSFLRKHPKSALRDEAQRSLIPFLNEEARKAP